jgi:hypothetical protein
MSTEDQKRTEEVRYQVTKAECQARIDGVCPGCGGPITAIDTVDNSNQPTHWQGCEQCSVFTEGVSPEMYRLARRLVEENVLVPYRIDSGDSPEECAYWLHSQTAGAARVLQYVEAWREPKEGRPTPAGESVLASHREETDRG